jgi:tetratricopeptide (TPR) repeat protein
LLRVEDGGLEHGTDLRLTMLETIREYGLERLEADGEMAVAFMRHADYFLALAEAAESALDGPDGAVWRLRLAREHDNMRAALDWLLGRGESMRALRLAGALARFWSERGYLSEGRRWLREALAADADSGEMMDDARRKALVGAATLAIEQAAYDEAADLCAEAFALVRTPAHRVTALNARGLLERARGRYPQAVRDHEEAYALATASGDRAGAASALIGQATASAFTDFARSASLAEQSVAAFRALGDTRGLAEALLVLLWRAMNAADYTRAETLGAETLDLFRAVGDTGRLAEVLFVLGVTAQFQGHYERATALHEEGLALRRARGDVRGAMEQLSALAVIALQRDDTAGARALLDETLATLRQYDDPWGRAMSLALLAQVELAAGEAEKAQTLLAESAAIFGAIGNLLYAPWCLEGLAGVAAVHGEWERAAQICGVRDALHDRMGAFIPPAHPAGYGRTLATIRAALGAERFATTHAEGKALSAEEALAAAPRPHGSGR